MNPPQEQAYQSAAWAEFYDLMVEHHFGSQPAPDAELFSSTLEKVLPSFLYRDPVTILDIGSGTGRVIQDLLSSISRHEAGRGKDYVSSVRGGMIGRDYRFTALDNAQIMLDRAVTKISTQKDGIVEFEVDPVCASATQLSKHVPPSSVHLALFAAGSVCHLTADGEVAKFLQELKKVLKEEGRAVISILKEFLISDEKQLEDGRIVDNSETLRLPSREEKGIIYVKYPTQNFWKGTIRTDSWQFDIENEDGAVLERHVMSMDVSMLSAREWEDLVRKSGLHVIERVEGDIQVWWVLKKAR
jgi:SAM-dependent methyltransferase